MHRFDRPTVLVTKTDLTYTVTLKTFCTLPSDNRQDAVDSQPLLRQPAAETERVGRVEIEMASRPWARTKAPPARIESSGIRGASSTQHSSTLFLCWPPLTRKSFLAASLGRRVASGFSSALLTLSRLMCIGVYKKLFLNA